MKNHKEKSKPSNLVESFQKRRTKLLPSGMSIPVTAIDRALGSKIVDLNGKEYIDFISGVGVMAIGHGVPEVKQAVIQQIDNFSHTCFGAVGYSLYLDVCEQLIQLFPHEHDSQSQPIVDGTKVFLTNSGSDSVENAIKIARAYTRRSGVVSFTQAFHGRHYMSMSVTDKPKSRKYCAPLLGDINRLRFPSYFHYNHRESHQDYLKREIQALKNFFHNQVNPEEVATVILELVQGEGGFHVMPTPYLKALKEICNQHQILIIVDEVQSGFGRTGKWAAYQHYQDIGFTPDISTWAKAIGAGYPLGAIIAKQKIMDGIPPGLLGGTYSGNPIACAAGKATLNYMNSLNLPKMAEERGEIIRKKLEQVYQDHDAVGEIRGLGAMLAMELCKNRNPNKPDTEFCKSLITRCRESGLLLLPAGPHGNVVRILCPLNIEIETLHQGLEILENQFKVLVKEKK